MTKALGRRRKPPLLRLVVYCRVCGSPANVKMVLYDGEGTPNEAIIASSLPPSWIVADSFPPGDDGLGFFCSEKCLCKYFKPGGP